MKLSATSSLQLFPMFQRWKTEARAERADATAQFFAKEFVKEFSESVVLARIYLSLPYERTQPRHQAFASAIAKNSGEPVTGATPLLSLAGSAGIAPEWNDPTRSNGHVAIPLTSPKFISSLPMVAELFSQLGLLPHYFPRHAAAPRPSTPGEESKSRSLFFVPDARSAKDAEDRFIIPAREFVTTHKVASVFGGAERFDDQVAVCFLVFANEVLSTAQVQAFSAVSHLIVAAMTRPLARHAYFA